MSSESLVPCVDSPKVFGLGFVALDLVYRDSVADEIRLFAGGTCGNVLAALGLLGWQAFPIGRLDAGPAAAKIRDDFRKWDVRLDLLSLATAVSAPIVIQRVHSRPRGGRTHSFSRHCPGCGASLPPFRPVTNAAIQSVLARVEGASVFFFDRVSRSAITLASHCAAQGALIFFEPSGIGDPGLFAEALSVSHILKYSQDRVQDIHDLRGSATPLLEIETLGAEGLRYQLYGNQWRELSSFAVRSVVDTSGAGDWCTVGIIHAAGQRGLKGFQTLSEKRIRDAIRLGQAMAAWNCQFEGARGGMYRTDRDSFLAGVQQILEGERNVVVSSCNLSRVLVETIHALCRHKKPDPGRAQTLVEDCLALCSAQ